MSVKKYFEFSRFWLLMKMEFFRSQRGVFMTLVIIYGFLFFIGLLLSPFLDTSMLEFEHYSGYAFTLLIGGFILSSLAFRDLGSTLKKYHYLALPASTLEKFLSMWLLTTVGWIVGYTLIFTVYVFLANQLGRVLFSNLSFIPFDPFASYSITVVKYYFVIQGIFLVGATHFKGYVLPKTLFTLVLVAAICALIGYFIMEGVTDADTEECLSEEGILEETPVYTVWLIAKWLFWWALAPLCWVITYFGLKEKEV